MRARKWREDAKEEETKDMSRGIGCRDKYDE